MLVELQVGAGLPPITIFWPTEKPVTLVSNIVSVLPDPVRGKAAGVTVLEVVYPVGAAEHAAGAAIENVVVVGAGVARIV